MKRRPVAASSFTSEFFKLRKRPATWVIGCLLVFSVGLFGYFFSYQIVLEQRSIGVEDNTPGPSAEEVILPTLLPKNVLLNVLDSFSGGVGVAALVFGALSFGSEYGWGTLKTLLARPPGKLSTFFSSALAVGFILGIIAFLMLTAGTLSSYIIAVLEEAPVEWPPPVDFAMALGSAWLILSAYGSLGIFFAVLFKSAATAVGAGLLYTLVLELFLLSVQASNNILGTVQDSLLAKASEDLTGFFGTSPQPAGDVVQDALALGIYVVAPVLLAAFLFWRRDVA